MGRLVNGQGSQIYSTWKVILIGVPFFFGERKQEWNQAHKAAQAIFHGLSAVPVRASIHALHSVLYAHSAHNNFGVIQYARDIFQLLHGDHAGGLMNPYAQRVKPAVYTYVIALEDDSLRFSETGADFFADYASKHALHSNCATAVRYSGEFHPRPAGGWDAFSDSRRDEDVRWELLVDNNSGTYAPDPNELPMLQKLLQYNFPGLTVIALDRQDAQLEWSKTSCRAYALNYRTVHRDEIHPQIHSFHTW